MELEGCLGEGVLVRLCPVWPCLQPGVGEREEELDTREVQPEPEWDKFPVPSHPHTLVPQQATVGVVWKCPWFWIQTPLSWVVCWDGTGCAGSWSCLSMHAEARWDRVCHLHC